MLVNYGTSARISFSSIVVSYKEKLLVESYNIYRKQLCHFEISKIFLLY